MRKRILFFNSVIAALLSFAVALPAVAQSESEEEDGWDHSLAVYLWGAGIDGTTSSGSELSVDFGTIADNLNFGAMGSYLGRKGKWSMLADVIYMDLSADEQFNLVPPTGPGTGINADVGLDFTSWIINAAGGYNIYDREGTVTDLVFGVRYLDLSSDMFINFSVADPEFNQTIDIPMSGDAWDAIVGARGVISLGDRWFLPWGANVGAGDSDLTWQAMAGIAFKASSWADIALTYRYLKWEMDDGSPIEDLAISGPLLGVIFRF